VLKKKFWANFQRIIELFTQKIVNQLSKIWVWDPGSEIRDPEKNLFQIPDPGVKKPPEPGSRIRIRNTANLPPIMQLDLRISPQTLEKNRSYWDTLGLGGKRETDS
jgi:hypothetical protein